VGDKIEAVIRIGVYDVERELGKGAMGTVYLVRHRGLGIRRAIKVLAGNTGTTSGERFVREIELLGRVGGSGIVPVHEAGVFEGRPFYVMDLMPGGTLRERLRETGALPWKDAARIVRDLARALERCHASGLVHRDLKPDNVLFDEQGAPRIADFGCARDMNAQEHLTRTGTLIGTPSYMAPEQLEGKHVDARADVYGLGVILHELVTGDLPYTATSVMALIAAIHGGKRARLKSHAAPSDLDIVVDGALEADASKRIESAEALALALDGVVAMEEGPDRRPLLAGAAGVVVLALGAALFMHRSASEPKGAGEGGTAAVPVAPQAPPTAPPAPPAKVVPKVKLRPGLREVRPGVYAWKLPQGEIEMVRVPGDAIDNQTFFIGRTELTVGAYKAFCKATGHEPPEMPEEWKATDDFPVIGVNWDEAKAYCEWGKLHLPTLAEWLRAAGAGDGRKFAWGNDPPDVERCQTKSHQKFGAHPAPVGSFLQGASPCGALDMTGNVREWCEDVDKTTEQTEEISVPSHSVRGGGYGTTDDFLSLSNRDSEGTVVRLPDVGFRPALSEGP
jgi:formylglycine-generating enzyme required for sulfatase activity